MVSRGATLAPDPKRPKFKKIDLVVIFGAFALAFAAFLIPGWPEIIPDE